LFLRSPKTARTTAADATGFAVQELAGWRPSSSGHRFLSRGAYRLGYACQRETRSDRLMRKARKLHRALGGHGESLDGDIPDKPNGMHWRTYERKVAEWIAAEQRAAEAWLLASAPLFRRLGIV